VKNAGRGSGGGNRNSESYRRFLGAVRKGEREVNSMVDALEAQVPGYTAESTPLEWAGYSLLATFLQILRRVAQTAQKLVYAN
jgi:hypothetical protein